MFKEFGMSVMTTWEGLGWCCAFKSYSIAKISEGLAEGIPATISIELGIGRAI